VYMLGLFLPYEKSLSVDSVPLLCRFFLLTFIFYPLRYYATA